MGCSVLSTFYLSSRTRHVQTFQNIQQSRIVSDNDSDVLAYHYAYLAITNLVKEASLALRGTPWPHIWRE